MKIKPFLVLTFLLGTLTACVSEKVSDLEIQIQNLEQKLEEATDPEGINDLQRQLVETQREHIGKKEKEQEKVFEELEKTEDKESCETLKTQYNKLEEEITALITRYTIAGAWSYQQLGECSETGYEVLLEEDSSPSTE